MRPEASVLHLDLDAFFAAVEQRDKPSLRGKPVVVGGLGPRGVVATASYEARAFGVRSAMPTAEARRRCPQAAFLGGRYDRYRQASTQVMALLRELSPRVEPLSIDEAFVDLRASLRPVDLSTAGLLDLVAELKVGLAATTHGLTASVGIGTSKFMAKVATELRKPDGVTVIEPGSEVELLAPMPVSVLPGVGPVSTEKLRRVGLTTVADLQQVSRDELAQLVGAASAATLTQLAFGRDDRPVEPEREAKSISVEDTFEVDVVDADRLRRVLDRDARAVASRLRAARLLARTVSIKVRLHDFATHTRSRTLLGGTDQPELISELARSLLAGVDTSSGVRLIGVGVAGLTDALQEDLFEAAAGQDPEVEEVRSPAPGAPPPAQPSRWLPGADVAHEQHGPGWVWGAGLGRVTVRFETRHTGPGPVRTLPADDPALTLTAGDGGWS